jgi:hypothetical protein
MATLLSRPTRGPIQHVTQAKHGLRSLLIEQLPLWLQRGDLEAADDVQTPPPYAIYPYERETLDAFPSVEIVATSSRPSADSYAQVVQHRLAIGFTLAGDDVARLTVQVERYMWALRQICRDTLLAPDCPTGPIESEGEQYTPLDRRQAGVESPFVKGGFLEVTLTTVE